MPDYIFIDGSYFCFYRYHSLLTWWKNAYPEQKDVLENPFQNETFVEKFQKTFVDNLVKMPKNLKIAKGANPTLIVGKDCKRTQIWRNSLFPAYKANRSNGAEDGFMGGPFFEMAYHHLFADGGVTTILEHPHLEADDCIALTVKRLLQKHQQNVSNDTDPDPNLRIFIITSDKDYLQLAGPNVFLYNLAYKNLAEQKSSSGNNCCDLFCKILMGDLSDNIPSVFPKCGPKTALRYFENPDLLELKLAESTAYRNQYELNKRIIDFDCIPAELAEEFFASITVSGPIPSQLFDCFSSN